MYSRQRKDKFFDSLNKNQSTIDVDKRTISALLWFEKENKKDFCEFTYDEISKMYQAMPGKSHTYYAKINGILKEYTDWCIKNKYYNGPNNYVGFNAASFVSFREVKYYRESTLLSLSGKFINPVDKFILLAPFYGFRNVDNYREITELNSSSFDITHNEIIVSGRRIKVAPTLISCGLEAINTYSYQWGDGIRTNDIYGPGIIKYRNTKSLKSFNINMYISNKYNRVIRPIINDDNCTYKKIYDSGIISFTLNHLLINHTENLLELWRDDAFQKDVIDRFQIVNKKSFLYVYGPKIQEAISSWKNNGQ